MVLFTLMVSTPVTVAEVGTEPAESFTVSVSAPAPPVITSNALKELAVAPEKVVEPAPPVKLSTLVVSV